MQNDMVLTEALNALTSEVIVTNRLQVTSFFPSVDKLKRLFLKYALNQSMSRNDHDRFACRLEQVGNGTDLCQFIICYVLINLASGPTGKQHQQAYESVLERVQTMRAQCSPISSSISWQYNHEKLIILLEKLITYKQEHSKCSSNETSIYDFVELETDALSYCFHSEPNNNK